MAIPLVAIVGRPNVGKSTFFNKMAGRRIAIVDDTPGVTRDRIYADCQWQRHSFTLVDTGGIDPYSEDPLLQQMRLQAQIAIEMSDAIIFLVDGKEGMTGSDEEVADLLRRSNKPVLVAVNKIDNFEHEINATDFYELGFGTPHPISSVNLLGFGDLLDELCELLPEGSLEEAGDEAIKVAVCGKPNVGKSSLVNRLLGEERVMVSDIAGTTRDAIDSRLEHEGREYIIIDTAGIRRKARINEKTLERYSVIRAFDAIRRSDVALLLIDATQGVTEQDTKVAGYIEKEGKACIVIINKWDSLEKETGTLENYRKQVLEELKFMDYVPVMFISALTGQRIQGILPLVAQVYGAASHRVTTGMLNDAIHDAIMVTPPPTDKGRRLRIFYATQQSVRPPTFVLFTNDPKLMHFSYERYIENYLRKTFPFDGTPIRIIVKGRDEKKESAPI